MRFRRPARVATAVAMAVLLAPAASVTAQTRPTRPPGPAGGQGGPSATQPAPPAAGTGSPTLVAPSPAATKAAINVAREAAALVDLHALGSSGRLQQAVATVKVPADASPAQLVTILSDADQKGPELLTQLAAGVSPSEDVQLTMATLSAADRTAARRGSPISIDGESYLRALDHLLHHGGGPPSEAGPPDPAAIAAELAALPTGTAPASSRGFPWTPVMLVIALAAIAAAAVAALRRRPATVGSAPRPLAASPPAPPSPMTGAATPHTPPARRAPASMEDLLEASRHLTAAASGGNIERVLVRQVLGLVPSSGAALIRRDGDVLSVAAESDPSLFDDDGFEEGSIRRVADTGQPLVQVSATEPGIRNLPAALAAYPLVGGGRVEAVLVLVRADREPFTVAERELLQAFAPVAAAALHNARETRAAIEDSLVDPLTGVGNRRRFDADLAAAVSADGGAALFIADLDHFKRVNDVHGHPAGDALLREVARLLREGVRPGDRVYRFGGEEFCVLMPETDIAAGAEVAERVRATIGGHPFDIGEPDPLRVTASFGVAVAASGDAAALVSLADAALYRAKEAGRDRVEVAAPDR